MVNIIPLDQLLPYSSRSVTVAFAYADNRREHANRAKSRQRRLVSCPRISRYIAGGQLAVFQGASEAPISESYGSSEQRGKTANWPRPKGLRSKWAGGRVARRLRIDSDMLPLLPVR